MSTRASKEQARQDSQKQKFVAGAAVAFAASLGTAVVVGHRRAHRAAALAGETIDRSQARIVLRAFGFGTLYAVVGVGGVCAVANYFLRARNVTTTAEVAQLMREKVRRLTGRPLDEAMGVDRELDRKNLEWLDGMVDEAQEHAPRIMKRMLAGERGAEGRPTLRERARNVFAKIKGSFRDGEREEK